MHTLTANAPLTGFRQLLLPFLRSARMPLSLLHTATLPLITLHRSWERKNIPLLFFMEEIMAIWASTILYQMRDWKNIMEERNIIPMGILTGHGEFMTNNFCNSRRGK